MGKFFIEEERVRITFDDGEWVDVKEELTQEDDDYIISQMARGSTDGKSQQVDIKLGSLPLLSRAIIAWSFKDIPVTRENISLLRKKYRTVVLTKVNELYRSELTKKL